MARIPPGCRRRPDGSIEKRFYVNGKRYSVYAYSANDLQEKELALREELRSGRDRSDLGPTLDQYYDDWISQRKGIIKGNTIKGYENKYRRHISPVLGNVKIAKIDRRMVKSLQSKCAEKLKPSTVNNVMVILKAMLADAVLEGVIEKSPMKFFDQIKLTTRATDTYHRALTEKEQASFFRTAKKESHFFGVYAMMICTGMRSGEVCALRWEDVDLQKRIIHVRRTVTYNADATITEGSPKTYAGIRDVPITDKCLDILESQRRWLHKIGFPEDEIVFPSPEGKYIRNGSLNDEIIRIRRLLSEKGIRIEHFTTHALRDTFATRYIEQGGSPQSLKEIMGHASIATTMDLYAQVLPETKKKETSRIKISV